MSASSSAKSMQATALGPASGEEDSTQNDRTEVAGPRRAASSNDSAKMPKWLKLGKWFLRDVSINLKTFCGLLIC